MNAPLRKAATGIPVTDCLAPFQPIAAVAGPLLAKILSEQLYLYADESDSTPWQWLREQGVDYLRVLDIVGPTVRHEVTFLEGGLFEFNRLGEAAFLQVVHGEDGETPIDIIALSPRWPDLFGTMLGRAALLGVANVVSPARYNAYGPCPLWRTPLRWLQEGCTGAVVLDPIPAGVILARAPGRLAAEDRSHANQLVDSGAARPHQIVIPRGVFHNV
jgi:hypothetical protein